MKASPAQTLHLARIGSDRMDPFGLDPRPESFWAHVPVLRAAIRSRQMVRFYYSGDEAPGFRTVEPHTVAHDHENHLALSAWYVSGDAAPYEGQGWREYRLSEISLVTVLPVYFFGSHRGYQSDGEPLPTGQFAI
jgi:predicted DNA-binding transcriptional regulator YafY